jgi:hypothetical protein
MCDQNDKLLREEVRGVFVLGIIGTLLALGRGLDVKVFFDVSLATLANGLVLYWGMYVVFMAIGVSDDIVKPRVSKFCNSLAKVYFVGGLAILMVIPIVVLAYYALPALGVLITWPIAAALQVVGVLMAVLIWLGLRREGGFFS